MNDSIEDHMAEHNLRAIAFYNVENLFDIYDDTRTYDDDFLPINVKKWTPKRYDNKLRKLGYTISNIGKKETGNHPALVGLAEVENAKVIEDLLATNPLKDCHYKFVHYNSLDERGIDVALLYDTTAFEVTHSEVFRIFLENSEGLPDYTRDILLVSGLLDGEAIHVIINHWSSRREGEKESEPKRMAASNKVTEIIARLREASDGVKIIVMGDFNDNPSNNSMKQLVENSNLFNPMETLRSFSRGTTYHNRQWNLFDQIIVSTSFFDNTPNRFEYETANIFDEDFLKIPKGKFKGSPFRTYAGKKYAGGYSDHFPVYAVFKKN
ncbi:endonuclease [Mariniflexile aquimaris]|uniref:Endonuclease n=1 Tax=Mariniflexile aquimaris TaxID=881009 RepID=A0ABW3BP56_9FLAO